MVDNVRGGAETAGMYALVANGENIWVKRKLSTTFQNL